MSERGTRWTLDDLPEGWVELGHQARKKLNLPRVNLQIEAAKFCDYWKARAGKGALKLDWLATWRVWARNAYGAQPEATPADEHSCGCEQDLSLRRARLAAKGIRSSLLSKQDIELGVGHGVITREQAKKLGL